MTATTSVATRSPATRTPPCRTQLSVNGYSPAQWVGPGPPAAPRRAGREGTWRPGRQDSPTAPRRAGSISRGARLPGGLPPVAADLPGTGNRRSEQDQEPGVGLLSDDRGTETSHRLSDHHRIRDPLGGLQDGPRQHEANRRPGSARSTSTDGQPTHDHVRQSDKVSVSLLARAGGGTTHNAQPGSHRERNRCHCRPSDTGLDSHGVTAPTGGEGTRVLMPSSTTASFTAIGTSMSRPS